MGVVSYVCTQWHLTNSVHDWVQVVSHTTINRTRQLCMHYPTTSITMCIYFIMKCCMVMKFHELHEHRKLCACVCSVSTPINTVSRLSAVVWYLTSSMGITSVYMRWKFKLLIMLVCCLVKPWAYVWQCVMSHQNRDLLECIQGIEGYRV